MNLKSYKIAIDGFSSCGKSTVAKILASKLNFLFIDSGALYRAVTWYVMENRINASNSEQLKSCLSQITLSQMLIGEETRTFLNGSDISSVIRHMEVSNRVSQISSLREVRDFVVIILQKISEKQSVVMDGRDIGTIVFPDADVKIFMDARPEVRAQRRFDELLAKGENVNISDVMDNLLLRDKQDSTREESPLVRAIDAYYLDTSDLTQDEVLEIVMQRYTNSIGKPND